MLEVIMAFFKLILVPLFAIGMVGSIVVVAITFVHDVIDFVTDEDPGGVAEPPH